jgi:hypothetical protein
MTQKNAENSANNSKDKKLGVLNLVRFFEAEAAGLISAAERGAIIHGTSNIRDSGSPVEHEFRDFLTAKLPTQFRVLTGYLFDTKSECTPQIDAVIVGAADCHEIMRSTEGSSYVPFTSALAVFEVKNSTYDVESSLNQLKEIKLSVRTMQNSIDWKGSSPPEILTVLIFVKTDGCKVEEFQKWYNKNEDHPSYVVLLDRGIIVTYQTFVAQLLDSEENTRIYHEDHLDPGILYICRPKNKGDYQIGRTLLWLYYTIIGNLNKLDGNRLGVRAFTDDAVNRFPLIPEMALRDADNWHKEKQRPIVSDNTNYDELFGSNYDKP